MNWNQLQYMIAVAQEKNMTRAAKKLYISQPSLSISIAQLEKEVGNKLFERRNAAMGWQESHRRSYVLVHFRRRCGLWLKNS